LYCLDLANVIQSNAIIGIKSDVTENFNDYSEVINNLDKYQGIWKVVANSFTEWLELMAQNENAFGFLTGVKNLDDVTPPNIDEDEEDIPF